MAITTSDGQVVVDLVLDSTGAVRGARTASGEVVKFEKAADRAGGAMQKLDGWLKGMIASYVISGLSRAAAGVYQIATAIGETESKFRTVFGTAAAEMEAFGQRTAHVAGQTLNEFRDMSSQVGSILDAMGLSQADVVSETQRIMALAADLASFHNTTIEEAFNAIRSGLVGEQEPLKRYGIVLRESMVTGATEAEKVMSRLDVITRNAGKAVGDLARTQDSAANTGRRMAAVAREARDAFARELMGGIEALQRQIVAMTGDGEGLIAFAQRLGQEISALLADVGHLTSAFAELGEEFGGVGDVLGKLPTGLDQLRFLLDRLTSSVNTAVDALRYLKIGVGETAELIGRVLPGLDGLQRWGHGLAEGARAALNETEALGGKFVGLKEGADRAAPSLGGTNGVKGAADKAKTALQEAAEAVKELQRRLKDLSENRDAIVAMRARAEGLTMETEALEDLIDAQARHAAQAALGYSSAGAAREEAIIQMRVETAILENQIRQSERLLDLEVRRRLVGETDEQRRLRVRFPKSTGIGAKGPSALPTEGVDPNDVREVPGALADGFETAEERIGGTLTRIGAHIHNFVTSTDDRLRDVADSFGVVAGNLAEAFSGFFEVAVQSQADAFVRMGMSQEDARAKAEEENARLFGIWKAAAIAQALVNTYSSAVASYNALAGIPVVGPVLGAAAAATAVAAGLVNVARIRSTTLGGGGGGGASYGSIAPSGTSNLAAGLSLQGRGQSAPVVNVAPPAVTVQQTFSGDLDGLITRTDERRVVLGKARGNAGGL